MWEIDELDVHNAEGGTDQSQQNNRADDCITFVHFKSVFPVDSFDSTLLTRDMARLLQKSAFYAVCFAFRCNKYGIRSYFTPATSLRFTLKSAFTIVNDYSKVNYARFQGEF